MKNIWDKKFAPLAVYNDEIYKGIVHTHEYNERMKVLQKEYDARLRESYEEAMVPTKSKWWRFRDTR